MDQGICYSTDDEDFCFHSLDEVFDDLASDGNLEEGAIYYEVDFRRMTGKDVVSVTRLIEDMEERLYDEIGEAAEGGLDVSNEAAEELEAFIAQWIDKHTDVNRYYKIVGKSRVLTVTAEDLVDNLEGNRPR